MQMERVRRTGQYAILLKHPYEIIPFSNLKEGCQVRCSFETSFLKWDGQVEIRDKVPVLICVHA